MRTINDVPKFIETVEKMRKSQKEYFRTRSGIALSESKKLEKEVDGLLAETVVPSRINQPKLF